MNSMKYNIQKSTNNVFFTKKMFSNDYFKKYLGTRKTVYQTSAFPHEDAFRPNAACAALARGYSLSSMTVDRDNIMRICAEPLVKCSVFSKAY